MSNEHNYKQMLHNVLRIIHDEALREKLTNLNNYTGLPDAEETHKYIVNELLNIEDKVTVNAIQHPGRRIADAGKIMRGIEPDTDLA